MKNNKLRKKKSKKRIYSFGIAVLIALLSFLPYIHDFEIFKEREPFSGFSSFRIGLFFVSIFLVGISGWVFAFVNSKGKQYRFVILAPILMLNFQLLVYVLDKRDSFVNDFNNKVILNFSVLVGIIILYFILKRKGNVDG